MNDSDFYKMAGMLSKIAYELHDKEFVNEELKDLLLEFWRNFSTYEQLD